jgi:glycosyltransferase involved in cell wall biosynthesis
MTRTVGYFRRTYLPLTETFVYNYLSSHRRYEPFLCGVHAENLDKFQFEPRHLVAELSRWSPRFWLYGALAKTGVCGLNRTYYTDIIKTEDPNVLHAQFGPMGVDLCSHRTSERPLVTSFYGSDASQLVDQSEAIRSAYRDLFATGDLFLVEGPSMCEKLLQLGCPEEKIALQRIAIDTEYIDPRYPSPDGEWQVLLAGRFVQKKGMPDGIRAFASAFGDINGAELRIVGGESGEITRARLEVIATEHDVRDQVTFTGFLEYGEYLGEVRNCDLLLAPSKTAESGDSEGGAPTVLLEAQASGKPIVSTTHADIPYVVEKDVAGKLASPGDVKGIAAALRWFVDHPEKLSLMGKAGRENIERYHDISGLITQLERRYDRLQDGYADISR